LTVRNVTRTGMPVPTTVGGVTMSPAPPTKGTTVEVRIGVQNVARELAFESSQRVEEVTALVDEALKKGGTLALSDEKGRKYVVPVTALGYIHIGETEKSRVGFGTD